VDQGIATNRESYSNGGLSSIGTLNHNRTTADLAIYEQFDQKVCSRTICALYSGATALPNHNSCSSLSIDLEFQSAGLQRACILFILKTLEQNYNEVAFGIFIYIQKLHCV
jgi:hypothetical protein